MNTILISVIIPIYKVENFIEKCAQSLFEQTLDELEFIFVDDFTPDHSIDILKKVLSNYPKRQNQVRILSHEHNKGLPAARNTGMAYAKGEYIYHCDSDDYLEPDALECLMHEAQKKDADMVWCDWWLSFEHNERYMKQPSYGSANDALRGMLLGSMKYNVWNKLVRHSIYLDNQIIFPTGHGMGEDMTMIRLMACSSKVAYVAKGLYHYRKTNGEALTNSFTECKYKDVLFNTAETVDFIERRYGNRLSLEVACFKLNVKYPMLISNELDSYQRWLSCFPESNAYICKNPLASKRSQILQMAALKKYFWVLRLHYNVLYRFIYGFIYR